MKTDLHSVLLMSDEDIAIAKRVVSSVLAMHSPEKRHSYTWDNTVTYMRAQMKKMRKSRGWTQATMAQYIGVSTSRYTKIESSKGNFSIGTAIRIAKVFDCTVELALIPFSTAFEHQYVVDDVPAYKEERSRFERDEVFLASEENRRAKDKKPFKGPHVEPVQFGPDEIRRIGEIEREEKKRVEDEGFLRRKLAK